MHRGNLSRSEWSNRGEKIPGLVSLKMADDFYLVDDSRNAAGSKVEILRKKHDLILNLLQMPKPENKVKSFVEKNDLKNELDELFNKKFVIKVKKSLLSVICEPRRLISKKNEFYSKKPKKE